MNIFWYIWADKWLMLSMVLSCRLLELLRTLILRGANLPEAAVSTAHWFDQEASHLLLVVLPCSRQLMCPWQVHVPDYVVSGLFHDLKHADFIAFLKNFLLPDFVLTLVHDSSGLSFLPTACQVMLTSLHSECALMVLVCFNQQHILCCQEERHGVTVLVWNECNLLGSVLGSWVKCTGLCLVGWIGMWKPTLQIYRWPGSKSFTLTASCVEREMTYLWFGDSNLNLLLKML